MKTKIANLGRSCCMLSLLFITGIVSALPTVESHSGSGWVSAAPSSDPVNNPTLDLLRKVEFLQQEVQELRGKLEEQNHLISQLSTNQKKLYLDLDQRLQGSSKTTAMDFTETGSSEVSVPKSETSSPANSMNFPVSSSTLGVMSQSEVLAEEKAYQHAYHLVQNKDYEGAKQAFRSLVKSFPDGKYIPNAHYWLGEIYMTKGDLTLAYESFDSVYKQFPQHPKAADCLLKLGYVEYAKGQWKRSQELLAQVKNQFPGSTSAQLADARLQRMHKEGHL